MEHVGEMVVDGERFVVRGRRGSYQYDWMSGPNPGYGFGSQTTPPAVATLEEHQDAIRDFMAMINADTGYIEDDDED